MILSYLPLAYTRKDLEVGGNNNLFRIAMNPTTAEFMPIYVQEHGEWWRRIKLTRLFKGGEASQEYGHALTCVAYALSVGLPAERWHELAERHAFDMLGHMGYDHLWGSFRHQQQDGSPNDPILILKARIINQFPAAKRWIERHRGYYDRVADRAGKLRLAMVSP